MAEVTIKKCPSCGNLFECYSEDDCWCEHYQLNRKEYLEIIGKYDDCICPQCLGKFAAD
jgi:hypothetical protein